MKNEIFVEALSKSDARWDGKQDFFLFGLICNPTNKQPSFNSLKWAPVQIFITQSQ